ncbi:MAG TPA: MarR family winged helix-turn-helix transcriptional regulator [Sphingobium sp.]|nr:MarR family winged helix-turn-helix transcriptional regulator [Sphingobium sp.]
MARSQPEAQAEKETPSESAQDALASAALSSSLGYLLRRLQLDFKKHFTRMAGTDGFHPNHVGAMFTIGDNPGVTPSQLGAALGIEPAQVATMLNALDALGYIARKASKTDGRSRRVHLTAAGKRKFEEVRTIALDVERTFIGDALSPAETRVLVGLLSRLLDGQAE